MKNSDEISILPTYSETGQTCVLVIDKLDDTPLTEADLADVLETYIELLRVPSDNPDLAN